VATSPRPTTSVPLIFDLCKPRADVLKGTTDADFAADLAKVMRGDASTEYKVAADFFANTYPTRGLKGLLASVCGRLSGSGDAAAIFRLDTSYGGGKTHGLIGLYHAANGMQKVTNASEFIDPALVPKGKVRVAAFDGENADPANGRSMGDGVFAHTPWGEIAYALAGLKGYERVRKSDEQMVAPGAETIAELFGGEPTLILLDELSVYLRKALKAAPGAGDQLTAFLTSLFKAIESSPRAALVYTLALGKDGQPADAYGDENQYIADRMAEAESVSARKATLLNPTEDDETVKVLLRRLFERIDEKQAAAVVETYRGLWSAHKDALNPEANHPEMVDEFRVSYPFHPEVLDVLTTKTATLSNFQRVRGMLRILTRTIRDLWETSRPADATAIHLHHINPALPSINNEITSRMGLKAFSSCITSDISGMAPSKALAQEIDDATYKGMAPYTTYVARTIFMHSLAFNEPLKGVMPDRLRFSMLGPALDVSFIEQARQTFVASSAYLDDRPMSPMRFLTEANLTQIIRRQEQHVDKAQARAELIDNIRVIFGPGKFQMIPFPAGPYDVPDDVGDGRPLLVLMSYDALTVGGSVDALPELIGKIFDRKGAAGTDFRSFRNNLVFLVADEARKEDMRGKSVHRLALEELKDPDRLKDLAPHQQEKVKELASKSLTELAVAIQQCYRHVFYPSRARIGTSEYDLAHTALDVHATGNHPGEGQRAMAQALQDMKKLRLPGDDPDSPAYIRDRTPLRKGQITTSALRDEFRRDPALPILIENDTFITAIRRGIDQGEYVYRRGDLLFGKGDPMAMIIVDEQSIVFTAAYASQHGIWPRQPAPGAGPDGGLFGEPGAGTGLGPGTGTVTGRPPIGGGTPPPEPGPGQRRFTAEAVLKEALTRLWEQARQAKVAKIGNLTIKMFDASDAFKLLAVLGTVANATKSVGFTGGYGTTAGGELQFEFRGSPDDAKPLKEFLDAQFRAAKTQDLNASYELKFEQGLEMAGDAPEKLTEKLSKYASGAAYVTAIAEVQQ
jgi:hypothetical protein